MSKLKPSWDVNKRYNTIGEVLKYDRVTQVLCGLFIAGGMFLAIIALSLK